jgi:RNA polymerase sigma-70 factor (ECF subfamily)
MSKTPMSPLAIVETPRDAADSLPAIGSIAEARAARIARERDGRLRKMVDEYVGFVARVLRNAGTPQADVDDEVQRTFIVAARRLDDVRPGAEKGFLFRIALNLAAHVRRTMARRKEVLSDETPERSDALATPEHLTDQKRMREMLDRVLDQMDVSLRTVFVLYEFEELNMSEIADVLGIPRGTVASRLRRAREEFRARLRAMDKRGLGL